MRAKPYRACSRGLEQACPEATRCQVLELFATPSHDHSKVPEQRCWGSWLGWGRITEPTTKPPARRTAPLRSPRMVIIVSSRA